MDDSKVAALSYRGAAVELRRMSGAVACRIMHPPGQNIDPHGHDWPVLAIYRLGGYREYTEDAATTFDGPSVVFHPGRAYHADVVGETGLETLNLSFDPDWLEPEARAALPQSSWWRTGGAAALAARRLASILEADVDATVVQRAVSHFFSSALATPPARRPEWMDHSEERRNALNPAWRARAYRAWRGEGMQETARRHRVERATQLLRFGRDPLPIVAAEAGFCDQSHMNRCFHAVLGRSPLEVRREGSLLVEIPRSKPHL